LRENLSGSIFSESRPQPSFLKEISVLSHVPDIGLKVDVSVVVVGVLAVSVLDVVMLEVVAPDVVRF
jgi:hypothetical protein